MKRLVYINGKYCASEDATVSIFDRGILFADAIYEVAGVLDGKLVDFHNHMQRLDRSLREMEIDPPLNHEQILTLMRELVKENNIDQGLVYLQITRGSDGDREFLPSSGMSPTVFAFAQHKTEAEKKDNDTGIEMVTEPDIRWSRRDIKTVGLMGSVFAKRDAKRKGAKEVLLVENGFVTEGGATSFYFVKNDIVITRPLSNEILPGCTRKALLQLIETSDIQLEERLFTPEEARSADEAFITGASTFVCPVIMIDNTPVGDGKVGKTTRILQKLYLEVIRRDAV